MTAIKKEVPHEGHLLQHLLGAYPGSLARSVVDSSQPITVEFGLHLVQLIRLDEKDQILSTHVQKMHVYDLLICSP